MNKAEKLFEKLSVEAMTKREALFRRNAVRFAKEQTAMAGKPKKHTTIMTFDSPGKARALSVRKGRKGFLGIGKRKAKILAQHEMRYGDDPASIRFRTTVPMLKKAEFLLKNK